jgi:hypothetical protein
MLGGTSFTSIVIVVDDAPVELDAVIVDTQPDCSDVGVPTMLQSAAKPRPAGKGELVLQRDGVPPEFVIATVDA